MNKIDPGPGYRLLDPWEKVQEGDEVRYDFGDWEPSTNWMGSDTRQDPHMIYRRKIQEPSTGSVQIPGILGPDAEFLPESEGAQDAKPTPLTHTPPDWALPPLNAPKPFIPNKYTRYIPTLDGRCVPVDVYCVSEAFPLDKCLKSQGAVDAVNHARKKLLAPGQRGQKTALQDIKEAHASLARAIALEEAALGREV